jgi:hypothetical protein
VVVATAEVATVEVALVVVKVEVATVAVVWAEGSEEVGWEVAGSAGGDWAAAASRR